MSATVTFEGDNTVMAQQCFNYLEKLTKQILKGKTQEMLPIFEYLKAINDLGKYKCKASSKEDFLDVELLEEAVKV